MEIVWRVWNFIVTGVQLTASFWVGMMLTAAAVPDHAHAGGAWIATSLAIFALTRSTSAPPRNLGGEGG